MWHTCAHCNPLMLPPEHELLSSRTKSRNPEIPFDTRTLCTSKHQGVSPRLPFTSRERPPKKLPSPPSSAKGSCSGPCPGFTVGEKQFCEMPVPKALRVPVPHILPYIVHTWASKGVLLSVALGPNCCIGTWTFDVHCGWGLQQGQRKTPSTGRLRGGEQPPGGGGGGGGGKRR